MSAPGSPPRATVAWGVVVLVVAGLVVAGAVTGALAGSPPDPSAKRSAPREPGTDFPDGVRSYLPKVTATDIRGWMTKNDYECERDKKPEDADHSEHCWSPDGASASASVWTVFDDDHQVRFTQARCKLGPRSPEDYCRALFKFLVDTAYARQPTFRKQATAWTVRNADNDAVSVIGGMELNMELRDHTLAIYPEG